MADENDGGSVFGGLVAPSVSAPEGHETTMSNFLPIKSAYFVPDLRMTHKSRAQDTRRGTAVIAHVDGRVQKFKNTSREQLFIWQQHDFHYQYAPENIHHEA